jgi:hypothetical protein
MNQENKVIAHQVKNGMIELKSDIVKENEDVTIGFSYKYQLTIECIHINNLS